MAIPSGQRILVVPEPLAARLDEMVMGGEFASFELAGIAMMELGVLQHDQRVLPPAAGPPPPRFGKSLPPPGPPGAPPPSLARRQAGETKRS